MVENLGRVDQQQFWLLFLWKVIKSTVKKETKEQKIEWGEKLIIGHHCQNTQGRKVTQK